MHHRSDRGCSLLPTRASCDGTSGDGIAWMLWAGRNGMLSASEVGDRLQLPWVVEAKSPRERKKPLAHQLYV